MGHRIVETIYLCTGGCGRSRKLGKIVLLEHSAYPLEIRMVLYTLESVGAACGRSLWLWRNEVVELARQGPRDLEKHERGQAVPRQNHRRCEAVRRS